MAGSLFFTFSDDRTQCHAQEGGARGTTHNPLSRQWLCYDQLYGRSRRKCKRYMSHDITKPTKWLCAQQRLRSAWASAQSDQSLRCALNGWLRTQAFFLRTAKTLMIWVFAGRTLILLVLSCRGSHSLSRIFMQSNQSLVPIVQMVPRSGKKTQTW